MKLHRPARGELSPVRRRTARARALGGLTRTFLAQIEALSRYRHNGEAAITVQNLSVQDGGKANVGNVTQHARVMVSSNLPMSWRLKLREHAG